MDGGVLKDRTSVGDALETISFAKRGQYVGITLEAIRRSELMRLQAIPRELVKSAIRARSAAISSIFTQATGTGPTLASGMVPKMAACLRALREGVPRATVVDGREPHAVLLEIFTDDGVGTQVLPGVPTKVRSARYRTSDKPEVAT